MAILVFNAGSATLKFALFDRDAPSTTRVQGTVERFGAAAQLRIADNGHSETQTAPLRDHAQAAVHILDHLRKRPSPPFPDRLAVAHRFVHGGSHHWPLRLQPARFAELEALVPLAPLHMTPALSVAKQIMCTLDDSVPAFAIFDTAFFHNLPETARQYALPTDLNRRHGLRRFGFHGLAHRSLYEQCCAEHDVSPQSARVVSFQLGNGCSAAAIDSGTPLDCSMGLTPLEGLVMGTRAGDLDPGLLLHLLRNGLSLDELDELLQRRSGLLGVSGASADMRELLELERRGHAGARLAIELFCYRVRKYLGAYLAVLGGADAIVFGGGIGEHAPEIRRRCLQDFEWAGIELDAARNHASERRICTDAARVQVYVMSTNEERVIAADALGALQEGN